MLLRDSLVNKGSGRIDILGERLLSALFSCGSAALRCMAFMYQGRKDAGLEVARCLYHAMAIKTRSPPLEPTLFVER
jgi:hypothetical protein